jgi:C4-dicarboxylate-specific signal transduction histidine kinase
MQVFLNVITNSIRALSKQESRTLSVAARTEGNRVLVEFTDSGGGVAQPEHLFRPFQEGADSSGLGLYLSRAFLRSFGGEIRYQPVAGGACFTVSLNRADSPEQDSL